MKKEKNKKEWSKADKSSLRTFLVIVITLIVTLTPHFIFPDIITANWVIVVCFAVMSPFIFVNAKEQIKSEKGFTEEQMKIFSSYIKKMEKVIWYLDLTYICWFMNWIIPFYILSTIYFVRMVYILSNVVINGKSAIPYANFFIVCEFALAILLLIFLIYKLPDENLQTIVISISAAIIGGLLTFIGVLMSIKKSDRDRKEERLLQIKPFFFYTTYFAGPDYVNEKKSPHFKDFGISIKNGKSVNLGRFINSDKIEFYIKSIIINGEEILLSNYDFTVSKGELFLIMLKTAEETIIPESYILKANDIDGNELLWKITLNITKNENIPTNIELIK